MNCPACIEQLIAVEFQHIEVDVCLMGCQGVWLDEGELAYLQPHIHAHTFVSMPSRTRNAPLRCCPRCDRPMDVGHLQSGGPLLDHCPAGHGLWLDAGELQGLLATGGGESESAGPLDFIQRLFTPKELS
jgi:Zn-finger nucleic acid-binding protein